MLVLKAEPRAFTRSQKTLISKLQPSLQARGRTLRIRNTLQLLILAQPFFSAPFFFLFLLSCLETQNPD